ncbi:MAG: type IIA DNA topoisomerase subunit B [Nitrospinae bacterium]|nr:type IIA DNA topoisomerase subunit B [Nitrospinota bacterium]
MADNYTAKDITVLEGLEPVRVRPGMYIGGTDSTGLHHLVWEAVDNSVDEAINGHCKKIDITITADDAVSVSDDGRGIPVDKHEKLKRPALEIIMCTLHAGAKFHNKSYSSSGGLHGVGISVVNALSERLDVTVKRDGFEYTQSYSRGKPLADLKKRGATRERGTSVHFVADKQIFGKPKFNFKTICDRAETKAFINRGLKISVADARTGDKKHFHFENGILDYITKVLGAQKGVMPAPFFVSVDTPIKCEAAIQWTERTESRVESYCNSIATVDGGTHENGLRNAIVKTIRDVMERKAPKGKATPITGDDAREGLTAILSVLVEQPQFQGQTKDRLNTPETATQVEAIVRPAFEKYLIENPSVADVLLARVELSARARMASRAAREEVHRKGAISHRLTLPGKLADCSSTDPDESELFIVEGDSAGGSSKQARDRKTQAILPLRGKILNVENAGDEKLKANAEIQALVLSIGTGIGATFDIGKLRYGKVIIMTDADVDGAHISALLLTFFYRNMRRLIDHGHIYLSCPPLYRIEMGKEAFYAADDAEKEKLLAKYKHRKLEVSRFKGLGEMPMSVLKETTMEVSKRRLLRVTLVDEKETEETFQGLMGKDSGARFKFIQENAAGFDLDV